MIKIIDGKKYDTSTATLIAQRKTNLDEDELREEEYLYRKKTGEFFIHARGGESSVYFVLDENSDPIPAEHIIPLSIDDAKRYCEYVLTGEEYIAVFGDVEE